MTTAQIMFEIAEQECRCGRRGQLVSIVSPPMSDLCDPCIATRTIEAIEEAYREATRHLKLERARIACEISADYFEARDADDLSIPDVEDEE